MNSQMELGVQHAKDSRSEAYQSWVELLLSWIVDIINYNRTPEKLNAQIKTYMFNVLVNFISLVMYTHLPHCTARKILLLLFCMVQLYCYLGHLAAGEVVEYRGMPGTPKVQNWLNVQSSGFRKRRSCYTEAGKGMSLMRRGIRILKVAVQNYKKKKYI